MPPGKQSDEASRGVLPGMPGLWRQPAWLPIPLLVAGVAVLWVANVRVVWTLPVLHWLIHYGSVILGVGLIVIPAARSFLGSGQPSVLMIGCGVLVMDIGVCAMPSGFSRNSNAAFSIYNTSILLSALCHVAGVGIASRRTIPSNHTGTWLAVVYAGGMAAMGLVIWAGMTDRTPIFFIEGQGGTLLRSGVICTSAALFLLTAGLLWQANRRAASPFLYWYSLGLVLMAAGLAGSMLFTRTDTPLQWVARSTQFIGGVYMCVAALAAARDSRAKEIPLAAVEEALQTYWFLAIFLRGTPLGVVSRYCMAVATVAAALGLRLPLEAWVEAGLPTYLTFYPAVMLVALLAGFGPGVVATALAGLATAYWILPPTGEFAIASPADRLGLAVFAGMGLFMSAVAEIHRRYRRKAAAYDRDAALRETRREKEFLANLLSLASQPFAVGYPDGRLGQVNPAFEQLTGYTAEELRAIDWSNMLTPPECRDLER